MRIETERLVITDFTADMAYDVHVNSLDEDNRKFVPDEVFETVEDARETIEFLMSQYGKSEGPLAYPVLPPGIRRFLQTREQNRISQEPVWTQRWR